MQSYRPSDIRGMVFDLDGTLYVSSAFAATIQDEAVVYMAGVMGVTKAEAALVMSDTRRRMAEESGTVQTLSAVCTELGGNVRDLHAFFEERLVPENYLVRDERVIELLQGLSKRFKLYIYTNNNHVLATRIIELLGFEGLFERVFAIDDEWRAKPDEYVLEQVLKVTAIPPAQLLFIGDRYDVDLRLPEQKGCPVFLTQNVDQLLRLKDLIR
ncbi:MAG TPA: HAD family hydrolase [Desulfuromonadaceae bacterium]|jgi:putative hydrolase of the HAD superfamily